MLRSVQLLGEFIYSTNGPMSGNGFGIAIDEGAPLYTGNDSRIEDGSSAPLYRGNGSRIEGDVGAPLYTGDGRRGRTALHGLIIDTIEEASLYTDNESMNGSSEGEVFIDDSIIEGATTSIIVTI